MNLSEDDMHELKAFFGLPLIEAMMELMAEFRSPKSFDFDLARGALCHLAEVFMATKQHRTIN